MKVKKNALKLAQDQEFLVAKRSNYSILVIDAVRPRSVSYQMYEKLKNTPYRKFVADPKYGSMHNYGAAVDVILVDSIIH